MSVSFLDLKAQCQYRALKDEIDAAVDEVMENTAFVADSLASIKECK
jgi:hypothetical protein